MDEKEELKTALEEIRDSYSDFVDAILSEAEDYNAYDELIQFIRSHPDVTSSEVIRYLSEEIWEEPEEIYEDYVDDDE